MIYSNHNYTPPKLRYYTDGLTMCAFWVLGFYKIELALALYAVILMILIAAIQIARHNVDSERNAHVLSEYAMTEMYKIRSYSSLWIFIPIHLLTKYVVMNNTWKDELEFPADSKIDH